MHDDTIEALSIQSLLSKDSYLIPIYQRNYDWGEKETLQLIEDIADYACQKSDKNYYIGSLVVFHRFKNGDEFYETIDGQQRLTTLTILMNVLHNIPSLSGEMSWFKRPNLSYDHRAEADEALRMLYEGNFSDSPIAASIVDVYKVIRKNLDNILSGKSLSLSAFVKYLLSKVIIMRIQVPAGTELNHYFEIMNSRGEQLEKHEVLKASLMKNLEENDHDSHLLFAQIWEACSDMSTYVQMNMAPALRNILFSSDWQSWQNLDYDKLLQSFKAVGNKNDGADGVHKLSALFTDAKNNVKYRIPDSDDDTDGTGDRFGSAINFPNFLLQALKVMYHSDPEYKKDVDAEIKLDDKRLIDIFDNVIKHCTDKRAFTERYIMSLLRLRHLFDCYVIKREHYNGKESWSLKKLKKYDKGKVNYVCTFNDSEDDDETGKDLKMLEAMFHVSAPTQIYKHWVNAVLNYCFDKDSVEPSDFREYLYQLACAYMRDRYLCNKDKKVDFEDIIYRNGGRASECNIVWSNINVGCGVENFVFNFYDYVVWKKNPEKYPKFEFSYRTSVEHFYPQTPMEGYDELTRVTGLDDFGNLCLISRGMNSKFSNNMPKAKFENFGNEAVLQELSIKLIEMMDVVRNKGEWGKTEIEEFEKKSIKILQDAINNNENNSQVHKESQNFAEESV